MKSYVAPLYLLVFLPAVVFLYNIVPKKLRPVVLLLASYLFFWSISGKLILFCLFPIFNPSFLGCGCQTFRKNAIGFLPKQSALKERL